MATILREAKVWAKDRPADKPRASSDLTPEEMSRVRICLRFLVCRFGTIAKLANAMGANAWTVRYAMSKRGHPSAGIALRAARAAGVPLEDVLAGRWPVEGACPHCGRGP
jgi:hypothetical protein